MRTIDFADGFESAVQPTVEGVVASDIANTPAGDIEATDVQGAINELDSEKVAKISSTDNALPRFDGTDGDLQNSNVTVDDSGNVNVPGGLVVSGDLTVQGTTTTLNTATLDVEDQNITLAKGGNDVSAEGAGLTIDRTSTKGSLVFDSTKASKFKLGLQGAEAEVADVSSEQTLSNKTLTTPVTDILNMTEQSSAPATPASGTKKLYAKDDGKVYTLDSTGLEKQVGSGAGGGAKNYLGSVNNVDGNGDFELGSTSKWGLGKVGALTNGLPSGSPTFGSGANANLSLTVATLGNQIAGNASLGYVSSAATTAGDCVHSDAFTIDVADQAKVLTFKFYFKAALNPSNANWSGTSSNSFGVAIYDVTNSAWIIPTGCFGMTQSSGVGICTGTFQTPSNGSQFRLVVYNANATSGAVTVIFDDFSVSPQTTVIGFAGDDFFNVTAVAADFTGFGTPTNMEYESCRMGDRLVGTVKFTCGTSTAVEARVALRYKGATVTSAGTDKIPSIKMVGSGTINNVSSTFFGQFVTLIEPSKSYLTFSYNSSTVAGVNNKANGSTFTSSGQIISFNFDVPIAGWSSNVQMSSDTDTRVVALVLNGSSTTISSSGAVIVPTTVLSDTHAAFSSSTFTVPVTDYYRIEGYMQGGVVAQSAGHSMELGYKKNGSLSKYLGRQRIAAAITNNFICSGSHTEKFNAGDTIQFYGTADVTQGITDFHGAITRVPGTTVIAASEAVNMRYTNSAGSSIGTSFAILKFPTKVFDSHGWYDTSTGLYTVGTPGKFKVTVAVQTAAVNLSTAQGCALAIYKNGAEYGYLGSTPGTGASATKAISGSDLVDAVPGDTIGIYAVSDVATTLAATASRNHLSIERVGN